MNLNLKLRREIPLHIMILPALVLIIIFNYGPMVGIIIAFEKYIPTKGFFGSKWVGLDNFRYILSMPDIQQILKNTIVIAMTKIVVGLFIPVIVALSLNELGSDRTKRAIQTSIYLPHFLSWVILGGILVDILSPSSGFVNKILGSLGVEPIFFLGDNDWFQFTVIITNTWKEFGYATIIYLAAITSVDPNLYEAAIVDGANRWRQTWHITLPGMKTIIILMTVLSLGAVLNAGFDQLFNLYNPIVYETGDIIDTFVYRLGLIDAQFGPATAVGLFKSLVSLVFISVSYFLADKLAGYSIF
ncbi:MAG: protein lplB [Spirochaetaceae bacterium 4572_59]|nr:MAG: protein lplB [Spirochaetaceae bacterium 4572_59]